MSDILRNTNIYSFTEKYIHNTVFQAAQQVQQENIPIFKYLQTSIVGQAINPSLPPQDP